MLHLSAALAQAEEEGAASRGREALQYLLRVADAHALLAGWGGGRCGAVGGGGKVGGGEGGQTEGGKGAQEAVADDATALADDATTFESETPFSRVLASLITLALPARRWRSAAAAAAAGTVRSEDHDDQLIIEPLITF